MLFNKSLHQNIFPTDWKLAHVIPLFTIFYFGFRLHHLALKREQQYYIVCYISI
jgi:hypothetical protein